VTATLFITCGLQGAGKTTLAMRLEQEQSALRLTADQWLRELHPGLSGLELEPMGEHVERVQWNTAVRASRGPSSRRPQHSFSAPTAEELALFDPL